MRLNPIKCKEMLFDFLHYRLPIQSPLSIGAHAVESVESFKFLGVYFSRNLTWSVHCDKIIKKANKRLYIIYQLRKAGYSTKELVTVYPNQAYSRIRSPRLVCFTFMLSCWHWNGSKESHARHILAKQKFATMPVSKLPTCYRWLKEGQFWAKNL